MADLPQPLHQYWTFREELHEAKGILFKGHRIIIPTSMRGEMLRLIHETHMGAEKCKERARKSMYWPKMATQIEGVVDRCQICERFRHGNKKEPMIPHPLPEEPWCRVATDVMTYKAQDYLVVVDYFSKFVEVLFLSDKTAASIITCLKSVFARHGIPQELVSDNMPFASQEFQTFAMDRGFLTITSSPKYP